MVRPNLHLDAAVPEHEQHRYATRYVCAFFRREHSTTHEIEADMSRDQSSNEPPPAPRMPHSCMQARAHSAVMTSLLNVMCRDTLRRIMDERPHRSSSFVVPNIMTSGLLLAAMHQKPSLETISEEQEIVVAQKRKRLLSREITPDTPGLSPLLAADLQSALSLPS